MEHGRLDCREGLNGARVCQNEYSLCIVYFLSNGVRRELTGGDALDICEVTLISPSGIGLCLRIGDVRMNNCLNLE